MTLKASVIINTHNRPDYLEGCLLALTLQSIPHEEYEIIIVDNSSARYRDENRRIVNRIAQENNRLSVRYVYDEVMGGLTHSRNLAVTTANTNIIVQADDDSLPCVDYVGAAIAALAASDVALVKGRMVAKYEGGEPDPELISKLKKPVHDGYIIADFTVIDLGSERVEINPNIAYASNCAFKKDFYLKAGGYGPDGFPAPFLYWNGSGEYHYAKAAPQMGYKVSYEPKMSADHIIPANRLKPEFFFARSFYYGIGGSFDIISQGKRPFSFVAVRAILQRARNAAGHMWRSRHFEARREIARIRGFATHQVLCLLRRDIVEFCRRSEWLSFDFSKLTPIGRSKSRSQW